MSVTKVRTATELLRKIESHSAHIGIIGMGYVGLPLAVEFASAGFRVTGIDISKKTVASIRSGRSHIEDVPTAKVAELVKSKKLTAQSHYRGAGKCDVIIICVPTPLSKTKDPDISYIVNSLDEITRETRRGQIIVLESTTYPGTTEEVMRPRLEAGGLRVGKDFFLAFSPERVDPGKINLWANNYSGIMRANTTIVNTPRAQMDDELRKRLLAESKFLRGLFYFNLVRFFGDVPLIIEPENIEPVFGKRNPKEEVYTQIISSTW